MNKELIEQFRVIGLSIRTTNENGQSGKDIPELWNTFMTEGILAKIPNKIDNTIFCIYTDYEKDHTRPYSVVLGCKVNQVVAVPEGMIELTIKQDNYAKFSAKGNLMQGIVFEEWTKIWNSDLPRLYHSDFEVYGEKAQNPANAEVEIFISVK